MVLSRLTKVNGPGISTDTNLVANNADFSGITTSATSFNIGVTTIHSNLIEAHNIKSTGIITATGAHFSGNVSIAGTFTYEDVTNVDSIGIITARSQLNVGNNIKLGNAGVITATSFVGDGSGLIGVASTDNIVTGTAATFTGGVDINSDLDVDGHTNLDNVNIVGVATITGGIEMPDASGTTNRLRFGDDDDFQLYFGGNTATIFKQGSSGSLKIRGQKVEIKNFADNKAMAIFNASTDVRLTYNGNLKLNTTDTGINVNGNVVSDGLVVDGNSDLNGDLDVDGHTELDNVRIVGMVTASNATISGNQILGHGNSAGNQIKFTRSGLSDELIIGTDGYGNSTQYEATIQSSIVTARPLVFATNNTERLRIAGDGRIGINTTSPTYGMHLHGTTASNNAYYYAEQSTAGASAGFRLKTTGSHFAIYGATSGSALGIYDYNAGAERLTITSDGSTQINSGVLQRRYESTNTAGYRYYTKAERFIAPNGGSGLNFTITGMTQGFASIRFGGYTEGNRVNFRADIAGYNAGNTGVRIYDSNEITNQATAYAGGASCSITVTKNNDSYVVNVTQSNPQGNSMAGFYYFESGGYNSVSTLTVS